MYKVYMYIAPNNKKYIGQTCRSLIDRSGINGQKYKDSPKFYNAIKKYGFESFQIQILKDNLTLEEANYWESFYINYFQTTEDIYGYNLSSGGSNPIPNDETREKMRQSHLGLKHTEETKKKISEIHKGKTLSEATKQKISQTRLERQIPSNFKGKKHTKEAKEKVGRKNGKPVRCIETGQEFYSTGEACRQLNIKSNHISECINHPERYKTVGGYHWEYI